MNNPLNLFASLPASGNMKERQAIAKTLKSILDSQIGQPAFFSQNSTDNFVDISQVIVEIVEDSHFEKNHRAASRLLQRLIMQPAFAGLSGPFGPSDEEWILVTDSGVILQVPGTSPVSDVYISHVDVTDVVTAIPTLNADIELLVKAAKLTGGIVSSIKHVLLVNWLRFHQLDVPKTAEHVENLITLLKLSLPEPPKHGNYWGGISSETNETTLVITEDQRHIILHETSKLFHDAGKPVEPLINYLTDAILGGRSAAFLQEEPSLSWELLIETPVAKTFAQSCFDALHPQSVSTAPLPPEQRSGLLVAAIMLDFALGTADRNHSFCSSNLYASHNVQANTYDVRQHLTAHFSGFQRVNPAAVPLALQLILAGLAPEFLVQTPQALQIGSPGWVMLRKSVLLAESIAPGLSRALSYEMLMELGAISPTSTEQRTLQGVILVKCVLDWAMINELELEGADDLPTEQIVKHATTQYNAFIDTMSEALNSITTPPVSRRALAKSAILELGINPATKLATAYSGIENSLLDLYLARQLTAYNHSVATAVLDLGPANDLYTSQLEKQYAPYKTGIATILRLAMSRLKVEDRVAIEYGQLALYHVTQSTPPDNHGLISGAERNIRAPFGILIVSRFNSEVRAYELFPLQGQCRKNETLTQQLNDNWIWLGKSPDDADEGFKTRTYVYGAHIDYRTYYKGSELTNDSVLNTEGVLLERFGQFYDMRDSATSLRSPMQSFNSGRFRDISELIAQHNPPMTYDHFYAMGYDKTDIEQSGENFEKIFDTILNIIIPFKECIEGLASGNPDRRSGALFSCVMDATTLLFSFVGAAGVFFKAAASSSKLLNLGKVGGSFVLSLFNPLDGIPQLAYGGAKLIGKGALRLGHFGQSATRLGIFQLRRLTGAAGAYDLVKAVQNSGSAIEIAKTVSAVNQGRALFNDATISTARQVVNLFIDTTTKLPNVPDKILEELYSTAVIETTIELDGAKDLNVLIGKEGLSELLRTYMSNSRMSYADARYGKESTDHIQSLEALIVIEAQNAASRI